MRETLGIFCRQTREEILETSWEFMETQFMVFLGLHGTQIDGQMRDIQDFPGIPDVPTFL